LLVFAIYFVSYNRTLPPTADEMVNFGLAQSLAKWQILSIDQVSTVGPNPEEFGIGGHRYAKYGPLQAVLSVPLFWLAQDLPIGEVDTVLLLNHLVTALTAALLYLLVRRLGYRPAVALAVMALVIFGTPLWIHSKRYFGEPTITLCLIATLYAAYAAATTRRWGWYLLAGLGFGLAVAAKYVDAVLLAPIPLYLLGCALWGSGHPAAPTSAPSVDPDTPIPVLPVDGEEAALWGRPGSGSNDRPGLDWRHAIGGLVVFGLGAAPIAALLLYYDWVRFGNPLTSGYAHWEGFSTPMWVGVAGFLFSPGKSLFVYTPAFLLLFVWGARFWRRFPSFSGLLAAIVVLHLCLFGAWWVWWGAWAWGARFIVPILPLLAIALAEGIATVRAPAMKAVAVVLGLLSLVIQLLGISVDHTIYLVQLMPLNPRPDTLTLYDLRYQPILHQIPLMTRQWLDFAWIERSGPSWVNLPALGAALAGVAVAALAFAIVWQGRRALVWLPALVVSAVVVAGGTFIALHTYDGQIDPTTAAVVAAIDRAPANTGLVQLIPQDVIPYANWQKRDLPEIGWIEEPHPNPIITTRLDHFAALYPQLWVVTQTPPKVPSNGVEARLDRSLVQVGDEPVGQDRLLRYLTNPASLPVVTENQRFADGITLAGFALNRTDVTAGQWLDVILVWRAGATAPPRPDYTVFVHLVQPDGALVAQHDNPPASGYASTSRWRPGQVVYDDHAIALPADVPDDVHQIQVGLYLPSTGQRLPLLGPGGKPAGDTVTLDLNDAPRATP
jgi:hypothetical protein